MTSLDTTTDDARKKVLVSRYAQIAVEMGMCEKYGWGVNPYGLTMNMEECSLSFLENIKDAVESSSFISTGVILQLERGRMYMSENHILDTLHYNSVIGWDEHLMTSAQVELLEKYKDIVHLHEPLREAPPELQTQYVALLKFVAAFHERDDEGQWRAISPDGLLKYDGQHMGRTYASYIVDPDMVRLVVEHADRVDEVISLVKSSDIIQPMELRFILSGGLAALSPGAI